MNTPWITFVVRCVYKYTCMSMASAKLAVAMLSEEDRRSIIFPEDRILSGKALLSRALNGAFGNIEAYSVYLKDIYVEEIDI